MSKGLRNEIVTIDNGTRWFVREAVSVKAALNAIAFARATGSIGSRHERDETLCGGTVVVEADVVQLNHDGTERKPYAPIN
jgi:hypothetical protein